MKRLTALILALLLAMAALPAVADAPDPIVGVWYMSIYPPRMEIEIPGYSDYARLIQFLTFEENGYITNFELDWLADFSSFKTNGPNIVGKWEKETETHYKLTLIGVGTSTAYMAEGCLFVSLIPNIYDAFRKCEDFNYVDDVLNQYMIDYLEW